MGEIARRCHMVNDEGGDDDECLLMTDPCLGIDAAPWFFIYLFDLTCCWGTAAGEREVNYLGGGGGGGGKAGGNE